MPRKPRRLPKPGAPLKVPVPPPSEIREILGIPNLGEIVSKALIHISASQDAAAKVTTFERMVDDVVSIATRSKDDGARLAAYQLLLDLTTAERGRKWVNTIARAKESMQTGDIPKVHIELVDRRGEDAKVVEVKETPVSPPVEVEVVGDQRTQGAKNREMREKNRVFILEQRAKMNELSEKMRMVKLARQEEERKAALLAEGLPLQVVEMDPP